MFKRLFLLAAGLGALGLITLGILYQFFGLRIRPDGTLIPQIEFVQTPDQQARTIERHREAQRAATPPAASAAASGADAPVIELAKFAWPSFRGADRDGHYRDTPIRTDWPAAGLQAMWRQPVGGGYASFAVAGRRAFTIEQRGTDEVVAAYDVVTGRELWKNAWPAFFQESMGGDGPRATPTWADGLVYALGADGELRCLEDSTGKVVWRTNMLKDAGAANLPWGMAASPLVSGAMP